jgi:hypothetical protein
MMERGMIERRVVTPRGKAKYVRTFGAAQRLIVTGNERHSASGLPVPACLPQQPE